MKYRELAEDGDYQFSGTTPFLTNTPAAVAQAILTRLRLHAGEWFLDDRVGFDLQKVLGERTQTTRDDEVKRVIAGTQGVTAIVGYGSQVSPDRRFSVQATVDTLYGRTTITEVL